MKATNLLRDALGSTGYILNTYLSDLSDQDLLVRPSETANHTAWQLGHVILSERALVAENVPSASYPELPAGFAEQHSREKAGQDGTGYLSRAEYVRLFDETRRATVKAVEGLSDQDLDRPTVGAMAKFAPTLGALLMLVSNHTLMHGGQVAVVRRKLGKPILI